MSACILVVDEDLAIQELIAVNLERAGHRVVRAVDASGARNSMRATLPDMVILEWILPSMSGIDLVRAIRSEPRTRAVPLIMLTERQDVRDKIAGLEAGADDYMTKPFSPRELLARIAAVLRRRAPQSTYETVEFCGLRIEPIARRVTVDGSEIVLGTTEFRLLHFLMTHANRVHSRSQLLDHVWGEHFFGEERTVDVHIRRLRAAIRKSGHDTLIQTVRGTGYNFWAEGQ